MELLKFVRLIVVLVTMVSGERSRDENKVLNLLHTAVDPQQGQVMCTRLSKEPYFGVEMLLGLPWRIYYTWNMDLENSCLDMSFRNATPAVSLHCVVSFLVNSIIILSDDDRLLPIISVWLPSGLTRCS